MYKKQVCTLLVFRVLFSVLQVNLDPHFIECSSSVIQSQGVSCNSATGLMDCLKYQRILQWYPIYIYDRCGKFWLEWNLGFLHHASMIILPIIYIRLFVIKHTIMRHIHVLHNSAKTFEMFYTFEVVYDRSGIADSNLRKEHDFNYN